MLRNTDSIKQCVLRSRNYKFRDIVLPNLEPILIGRGPQTKIRDHKCSKTQIQITANYATRKATVLQLGSNPSEVDGKLLLTQSTLEVDDCCSINLLQGDLKYTLEFSNVEPTAGLKHKHHSSAGAHHSKRPKMAESAAEESLVREEIAPSAPSLEDIEDNDGIGASETMPSSYFETLKEAVNDLHSLSTEDRWEEYDHSKIFIFTPAGLQSQTKVAAFDLDNTLICTKSGKVFPVSMDDWQIILPEVPGKLKKLHSEGYKIVVFTNQKGISRGKTSATDFKKKVQRIVQRFGIPMQVLVSTGVGRYRKPNTGMWDYFLSKGNQNVAVDVSQSMYVGDAAGRLENWAPKKKKDFSCADRLFALNIGIKFFTPEEFFLGQKPAQFKMPAFDPRNIATRSLAILVEPPPACELTGETILSSSSEVIVFVGFPAAGKSHFAHTYLVPKGYVYINRDALGSWQKCVAECTKALGQKQRVVIDNTNPDLESRKRYIDAAKQYGVPCRCFLFDCSIEQAKHNNVFRELQNPDEKHVGVNDMVLNSFKSKFKVPSLKEGFSCIINVYFVPKFKNKHDEKLFKRFLIEK